MRPSYNTPPKDWAVAFFARILHSGQTSTFPKIGELGAIRNELIDKSSETFAVDDDVDHWLSTATILSLVRRTLPTFTQLMSRCVVV